MTVDVKPDGDPVDFELCSSAGPVVQPVAFASEVDVPDYGDSEDE